MPPETVAVLGVDILVVLAGDSRAGRVQGARRHEPAHVPHARMQIGLDEAGEVRETRRPARGVFLGAERDEDCRRDEVRRRVLEHLDVHHAASSARGSKRVLHLLILRAWLRSVVRVRAWLRSSSEWGAVGHQRWESKSTRGLSSGFKVEASGFIA